MYPDGSVRALRAGAVEHGRHRAPLAAPPLVDSLPAARPRPGARHPGSGPGGSAPEAAPAVEAPTNAAPETERAAGPNIVRSDGTGTHAVPEVPRTRLRRRRHPAGAPGGDRSGHDASAPHPQRGSRPAPGSDRSGRDASAPHPREAAAPRRISPPTPPRGVGRWVDPGAVAAQEAQRAAQRPGELGLRGAGRSPDGPVVGPAAAAGEAPAAVRLAAAGVRAVRPADQPGGEPGRHPAPRPDRADQRPAPGLPQDRAAQPQGRRRQDHDDRDARRHVRLAARRPRGGRRREPGPRHAQPEDPAGDQRDRAAPAARRPAGAPLHRRARLHLAGLVAAGGARQRAGSRGVRGVQRRRLPAHGESARALLQHGAHRLRHRPDALGDVRRARAWPTRSWWCRPARSTVRAARRRRWTGSTRTGTATWSATR